MYFRKYAGMIYIQHIKMGMFLMTWLYMLQFHNNMSTLKSPNITIPAVTVGEFRSCDYVAPAILLSARNAIMCYLAVEFVPSGAYGR